MLTNLLEQVAASENFAERAASGGFTFLLGMIIIFAGMTVLVLCVTAFGKAAEAIANKSEKKAAKKEETAAVSEPETPATTSMDEIPEDIRVAIIAAIAAYYETSGSKNEFTVRKIKKL